MLKSVFYLYLERYNSRDIIICWCELTRPRKALPGLVPIPLSPEHHSRLCNNLFALKIQDCSTLGYDILGRARCLNASECPCHSKFWTCQGSSGILVKSLILQVLTAICYRIYPTVITIRLRRP